MIDRIKPNSESSNLQGVVLFPASGYFLNAVPVLWGENCIVVYIQSRPCVSKRTCSIQKEASCGAQSSVKSFFYIKLLVPWEDRKK